MIEAMPTCLNVESFFFMICGGKDYHKQKAKKSKKPLKGFDLEGIVRIYIEMIFFLRLHLSDTGMTIVGTMLCLMIFFLSPALADIPHNDTRDNSVEAVVVFHNKGEPNPDSIQYLSWSRVKLLDNGKYKVTVQFRVKNGAQRSVLKKQIVIMDQGGTILKVMDCR